MSVTKESIGRYLQVVIVGLSGWCLWAVSAMQVDVGKLQTDKFTTADGLTIWQAIGDIRREIATLPKDNPPEWFKERVDRMELNLSTRLDRIERRMEKAPEMGGASPWCPPTVHNTIPVWGYTNVILGGTTPGVN